MMFLPPTGPEDRPPLARPCTCSCGSRRGLISLDHSSDSVLTNKCRCRRVLVHLPTSGGRGRSAKVARSGGLACSPHGCGASASSSYEPTDSRRLPNMQSLTWCEHPEGLSAPGFKRRLEDQGLCFQGLWASNFVLKDVQSFQASPCGSGDRP